MEYSDEIFNELCEKLEHKTIATSEVMVVLDAARMLPDANRRIKQLKAQLPPEMQSSKILLKSCEKGHSWLTAQNWASSAELDCPWCKIIDAQNRLAKICNEYRDLQYQLDSSVAENEALQRRIDAFISIGRKPLEECHKTQNILRDRLDRISGKLMQVPNLDWKNGDGVDDIAIRYMDRLERNAKSMAESYESLRQLLLAERRDHDDAVRHFQYLLSRAEKRQRIAFVEPCLPMDGKVSDSDKRALKNIAAYMESQRAVASPYLGWTEDVAVLRRLFSQ